MAEIRAFSAAAANSTSYGSEEHSDERLLNELLELLSHLEQHRTRLLEKSTGKSDDLGALAGVTDLVNAVVDFVTAHSDDPALLPSRVLARIADSLPYTQLLGEEQERITVATAVAVLSDWKGDASDRGRMVHDLWNATVDVLAVYCEALGELFRVDRDREEWRAMSELFVSELRNTFEAVQ